MFFFPFIVPGIFFSFTYREGFPSRFYIAGAFLEFVLSLILIFLNSSSRISKRKYKQMEYFIRIIIGLPVTIVIGARASSDFSAFIRLVFGILFFRQMGLRSGVKFYIFFFTAGMLVYSFLENYPMIEKSHLNLILSSVTFTMIFYGVDDFYKDRIKKILKKQRKGRADTV